MTKYWKFLGFLTLKMIYRHDEISIKMLKLCDRPIITPLSILFQNCIDTRTFSGTWKKSNIVPVHKKGTSRQLLPATHSCRNFLKESFSIQFLKILQRIIYFVLISLGSDLLILVNINFSDYCIKYINLLIVIHQKMSGVFSFKSIW